MIQVTCSAETYLYNTYHMTKAFYPSEEVVSRIDEKASHYVRVDFFEEWDKDNAEDLQADRITVSRENMGGYSDKYIGGAGDFPDGVKRLKYEIEVTLYRLLKERTGRALAWGVLMGVRPTKIAMKKLAEGGTREDIAEWYGKEFFVSRKKALLAVEIAEREKALLDRLDLENGYSLYVGIPFCPTVCSYCSFSSGALSDWGDRVDGYVEALCKELLFLAQASENKSLNTIYIGGGTPTTLNAGQLEKLLSCIDRHFPKEHLLEYTVEAGRPDSITEEKLRIIREHGVTRISINPQTMQQKTLDVIVRKHSVQQIRDAYQMARRLGFDNINMDLIAGLPGETAADMEDTLRQIRELDPDNLTVHSLAIKRAAKMGQKDAGEHRKAPVGRAVEQMIDAAYETAEQMGMSPYYLYRQKNIAGNFENVGYAKVDKAGIYNILIMEEKQSIIAAGAGASTKLVMKEPVPMPGNKKGKKTKLLRIENVKAIDAYIDRVDEMIERKGEWLWH